MKTIRMTLLSVLIVSASVLLAPVSIHPVHAVTLVTPLCGMILPSGDVKLVPSSGTLACTGNGLVIAAGVGTTTLDLNGWTIEGNYPSPNTFTVGILVNPGASPVTIFSSTAGAIVAHFEEGIDLLGASACPAFGGHAVTGVGAFVAGVGFVPGFPITIIANIRAGSSNGVGIHVGCSSSNTIENNMIEANGGLGIFIDNGAGNKILSNFITHHIGSGSTLGGGAGIEIHIGPGSIIKGNTVVINTNGLYMDGFSGGSNIKGNTFDFNSAPCTGLFGASHPPPSNCGYGFISNAPSLSIKGNSASNNAQDGIAVTGPSDTLAANTANNNGRRGIAFGNNCAGELPDSIPAFTTQLGNTVTISNLATGNGAFNYYWDGFGSIAGTGAVNFSLNPSALTCPP